jgi:hypothetical protein
MSGGGARRRVLDTVDANWEREFKFLRGRVPRRSTLGEKAGVRRFVAAELAELGLDADVWEIDAAHRSATGLRPSGVVVRGASKRRRLLARGRRRREIAGPPGPRRRRPHHARARVDP